MQTLIGRRIGHYLVEKLLHRGLTLVCLARDSRDNRQVALKVLPPEAYSDRNKVETFWREGVKGMTELRHPHIVPVYDMGAADGFYYIAMRFIAGGSLDDLLRQRGALPKELAVLIAAQVADALSFAHERGIIHRDVKPGNILISSDRSTAYLADFGIARLTGQQTMTEHGQVIGTPEYMAPEQIQGEHVDSRADIYSLGVTLYLMLTGAQPFEGEPAAILYHQVHSQPKPPRQLNSEIPGWLDQVIRKAMAKKPEQRYQRAADMAAALNRGTKPSKPVPGRAITLTAIGLMALLIIIFAVTRPDVAATSTSTPIKQNDEPEGTTEVTVAETREGNDGVELAITSTLAPDEPTGTGGTATTTATQTRPPVTPATAATGISPTRDGPNDNDGATEDDSGTPTPTLPALVLISPGEGTRRSTRSGDTTFTWQWGGRLSGEQHFQLRFYLAGGGKEEAPFGPVREKTQRVNLDNLSYRGDLEWTVALIVFEDGAVREVLAESPRRRLRLDGP